MKIRTGFVSNSSATSFLIEVLDIKNKERLISEETEQALLDYGFKYTLHDVEAIQILEYNEWTLSKEVENSFNRRRLGYYVAYNQDWVYRFLLENKIPFKTSDHYGDNYLFYDGKSDFVLSLCNPNSIYHNALKNLESTYLKAKKEEPEKIPISEWLDNELLDEDIKELLNKDIEEFLNKDTDN